MTTTVKAEVASLNIAYEAAHNAAVLIDRSNLGMLKFTGETRLDLINRMSTQKVDNLKSGEGAATILTTDIGRIIDRIILYATGEAVYCLTSENNGDNIARYLMRFVFFMDDFHVEDLGADTAVLAAYGCEARTMLSALFGEAVELPLHNWKQLDLEGKAVYLHRSDPIVGDGYFVMCQASDQESVQAELVGAGIVPASEETFEYLRIESGQPRFGHELTSDYIPLEANLWADVSFNKGCYTGQEIIARMESRGRLAKKLVRLLPEAPVEVGAELTAGGKKAGVITSVADGPGGIRALGFVRTAVLEDKPTLAAGTTAVRIDASEA